MKVDRISRIPRRVQQTIKNKSSAASQIDMSGVQDKLSELVELLSTPKYEDIKQLLAQLNIVSSLHRNTSSAPAPVLEAGNDDLLDDVIDDPSSLVEDIELVSYEDTVVNRELFTCDDDHKYVDVDDNSSTSLKNAFTGEEDAINFSIDTSQHTIVATSTFPTDAQKQPINTIIDPTLTAMDALNQDQVDNLEEHELVESDACIPDNNENFNYNTQQGATTSTSRRRKSSTSTHKVRDSSRSRSSIRSQEHQQPLQKLQKPSFKYLWKAYVDSASGKNYYHNKRDGVTTWDRPRDEELRLVILPDGSLASDYDLLL